LKEHLDKFLQFLRNYKHNFEYVWRLEFQQRGAPHFHIVLFPKLNYDYKLYYKWKRELPTFWRKTICNWDTSMQLYAVDIQKLDGKKNIFFYLSKYAAKESEVTVDNYHGRMYGFSSTIKTNPIIDIEITLKDFESLRRIIYTYMKGQYKLNEQFENYLLFDPSIEILIPLSMMHIILDTFQQLKYTAVLNTLFDDFNKLNFDT